MAVTYECPLCTDDYEQRTDLRIHLEVEHRKSELARQILEEDSVEADPTTERSDAPSPVSTTRS
ncbi:hypothetical protein ACYJ1Y_03525 [Natrialbaceae archaeon A-gly3]